MSWLQENVRADLPCMSCLKRVTWSETSVPPESLCVFEHGEACDYCESQGKENQCEAIPTLFEKDVSEILGLVDLIYAENTPEETKVAAMKEVKKAEGTLRKAWSMLNENIRAGRRLRLEVQGFEDEDHTEEDRTEDAGSNSEDAGAEDDEDGNGSTTDGEDGWDDWNLNNDCGVSYSYSITILAEAVSKMTKAISSLNGPGTSMADSFLSSDEETKGLVELVVQIQREIVPGEHDMRGIQAVKGQWDDTDDMYEELYEG